MYGGLVDFVPEQYDRRELDAAIDVVPVDLLEVDAMWGTPEAVLDRLSEFVDAGLRHLVMQPIGGLVSRSDALFNLRAMISVQRKLRRRGTGL